MNDIVAGPFAVVTTLLFAAGIAKAARPAGTAGALRSLGLPHRRVLVVVGGVAEAALAVVAAGWGSWLPALGVAVSYAAFTGFVALALRQQVPVSSCGCFGTVDTPPSRVHVGFNAGAAVVGLVAAAGGGVSLPDVVADQPWAGFPFVMLVLLGAATAALALTTLPRVLATGREVTP